MDKQCPKLEKCPFFGDRLTVKSTTDEITKQCFCMEGKENCARYYVLERLGPEHVPATLHPIQMEIAQMLVSQSAS